MDGRAAENQMDVAGVVREARPAPRSVRVACLILFLAIAAAFLWIAARTGTRLSPDFEYFYKSGRSLLVAGTYDPGWDRTDAGRFVARGSLEWYLPSVSRCATLLAWLPPWWAGVLWATFNAVTFLAIVRLGGRYLSKLPPQDWPVTQLLPFLAVFLSWVWEFGLAQVDSLTLLLLLGSYVCWYRRRPVISGFWLGLAILLKTTPVLLLLWFALKRQRRVVSAAIITVVLAGPAADVVAVGPAYAAEQYRRWLDAAIHSGSSRALILSDREMDWRNQSLAAVAARWLHETDYSLRFDNDPRFPVDPVPLTMHVQDLPRHTAAWLVTGLQGISLLILVWLGRQPANRLGGWRLCAEWSLFLAAMLWFMPVVRVYHVIWLYPAFAVLGGAVHYLGLRGMVGGMTLAALAIAVVAQVSGALIGWEGERNVWPQAAGIYLLVIIATSAALLVLRGQSGRGVRRSLPEEASGCGSSGGPGALPD